MKHLFILFLLASCTKSSPVTEVWLALHGHDIATYNHAQFCEKGDSVGIETIKLVMTGADNNPNRFRLVAGSIYFPPNGRVQVSDSLYSRDYYKLISKIN